jgi:hypothetical protein
MSEGSKTGFWQASPKAMIPSMKTFQIRMMASVIDRYWMMGDYLLI